MNDLISNRRIMCRLKLSERWWRLPRQLRFVLAGGYNTVVGYLVFVALYLALGHPFHYLVIAVIANVIATISAFVTHRILVFQSTLPWMGEFLRFYASQLASIAVGTVLLFMLVQEVGLRPLTAQAAVTVASVGVSYFLHRFFTFSNHQPRI